MVKTAKFLDATKKHLALISPLDWGLGHTTRCIPIIRQLLLNDFQIVIACNSTQKSLLKSEFPDVIYEELPGYNLSYGRSRWGTLSKLILQIPNMLISIKHENLQIRSLIDRHQPDLILSDNRYGFRSPTVMSILITHQVRIMTGFGWLADKFVNSGIHRYIRKFDECWIPDFAGAQNLGGSLSHLPHTASFPLKYIGPVSRFHPCRQTQTESYLLAVLSGPEPQRTILEEILLQELGKLSKRAIVIRGTDHPFDGSMVPANVEIRNLESGSVLNNLLCNADLVICRSGYTSVMDLVRLNKKAILIPTPGQAEQEYLAKYLGGKNFAVVLSQQNIDLKNAIQQTGSLVTINNAGMDDYKQFCEPEYLFRQS